MIRRLQMLITAAGIVSRLQLSSPCSSSRYSPPLQAYVTKQIMTPHSSPPAKLIKTSIRANPLAFGLCGVCSSNLADELEYIYKRNFLEYIKDDLMAYSLCMLILFGTPFVKSINFLDPFHNEHYLPSTCQDRSENEFSFLKRLTIEAKRTV